jgi:hypothetical protein
MEHENNVDWTHIPLLLLANLKHSQVLIDEHGNKVADGSHVTDDRATAKICISKMNFFF